MVRFPRPAPVQRSRRDWLVDISLLTLAAAFGVVTSGWLEGNLESSSGALVADQTVGALSCSALFLRKRWPVALTFSLLAASMYSHFVTGAHLVAIFTVAAHRPPRTTAWVGGVSFTPWLIHLAFFREDFELPWQAEFIIGVLLIGGAVGWGLYVRSGRQLRSSLIEQAQRATRETIAREMHDVLAHRLSLLSVHAGALEYHAHAPPEEIQRAAGVVRESAHQALEELRDILGVLRAAPGEESGSRPQPTLTDLPRLAEESRHAGLRIALDQRIAAPDRVPETAARTGYRVVQEGLTNARKHAPGADVTVNVDGKQDEWLTVEVRNPLNGGPGVGDIPGAGQGLVGLTERVTLAGGRLEHGWIGGTFRLYAWLPWRP